MARAQMRLAVVAAGLDILGGQGVQARALVDELRREGYRVDFLPINPRFPRRLAWLRGVPCARTALNQSLYLPSLRRLRDADVVHVFSASYWSFLLGPAPALLAARALGKRVVLNYHSGEADDHLARWGALVHPFLRQADEIVVPSEYLSRVFAQHGHRARVIRNVVDPSHFRYRERRGLAPRLLSSRNLEPHYRVENTIRAFGVLRSRHPGATLTIAGYGSQEARLRRVAETIGGGTRFVGRVEPAAMPRLYDEADIFLNSSVVDNQPVSILEAFAAGLPVVSTATGDLAAMVRHRETGLVVNAEDPEAMAEAVATLLDDPAGALALAGRARAEAESYTWPKVRDLWAEAYGGRAA